MSFRLNMATSGCIQYHHGITNHLSITEARIYTGMKQDGIGIQYLKVTERLSHIQVLEKFETKNHR